MKAVLLVLAGLMGAAGVMLAAAGAHVAAGVGLDSASAMLLFHACATIGTVLAVQTALASPRTGMLAAAGFVLGAALFSGDVAIRAFYGTPLFRMAAPSGGVILIASWLVLALAAFIARMRRS